MTGNCFGQAGSGQHPAGTGARDSLLFQLSEADLISCKCQSPGSLCRVLFLPSFLNYYSFFFSNQCK